MNFQANRMRFIKKAEKKKREEKMETINGFRYSFSGKKKKMRKRDRGNLVEC